MGEAAIPWLTELALAQKGRIDARPAALVRDPYVLEFLGLSAAGVVDESRLEDAMLEHLQRILREFGREFCFVARQFRITLGNRHHYVDLLFFHRRLRCLVAVDLKIQEFQPENYGQMKFYQEPGLQAGGELPLDRVRWFWTYRLIVSRVAPPADPAKYDGDQRLRPQSRDWTSGISSARRCLADTPLRELTRRESATFGG